MTPATSPRHTSRELGAPTALAWIFTLVSITLCVVLAIALQIAGIYTQSLLAYRNFHDPSLVATHTVVEHAFNRLLLANKILANFPFLSRPVPNLLSPEKTSELYQILRVLVGNQPQQGKARFESWISSFSDAELSISIAGDVTLTHLEKKIATFLETHSKLSENKAALEQLRIEQSKIVFKHALLAKDFSELLSLPSAYEKSQADQSERQALKIYKEGVFKDLPRLTGLKDGIADLVVLREELHTSGGAVKTSSSDPAKEFSERLLSMRTFSTELISEYETILGSLGSTAASVSSAESELKRTRIDLLTTLREILSTTLKPTIFTESVSP